MKIIEVVNPAGGRVFLAPDLETAHKLIGQAPFDCIERELSVVWLFWRLGDETQDELLAVLPESDYAHALPLLDAIPERVRDLYFLSPAELGSVDSLVHSVKREMEECELRDERARQRNERLRLQNEQRS